MMPHRRPNMPTGAQKPGPPESTASVAFWPDRKPTGFEYNERYLGDQAETDRGPIAMTPLNERIYAAVEQSRAQCALVPVYIRPDELSETMKELWRLATVTGTKFVRPTTISPSDVSVIVFARSQDAAPGTWLWKLRLLIGLAPTTETLPGGQA